MNVTQSEFVQAILNPNLPSPDGLVTPQGKPAAERFDVYRNNVAVSLTEALKVTFPILVKCLGDEFFSAMAGVFLRAHPPESPVLMLYGEQMPKFLESFEPVQQYPYLPDIARLEIALVQSYHAADSEPIDPGVLEQLSPEALMDSVLCLSSSVRLVRSPWPIYQLWQFNTATEAPKPQPAAEDVIVVRPEYDPVPRCLPAGGGAFAEAVLQGLSLKEALSHISDEHAAQNLNSLFGILIQGNAITAIR